MSRIVHAKPVWTWSLVLLSALLLPAAAGTAAFQAALLLAAATSAQTSSAAAQPVPLPASGGSDTNPAAPSGLLQPAPRRADDEWPQRLRARSARPLRFLGARPDTGALFAVLVPARAIVFVPDEHAVPVFRTAAGRAPFAAPLSPVRVPRAPPRLVSPRCCA